MDALEALEYGGIVAVVVTIDPWAVGFPSFEGDVGVVGFGGEGEMGEEVVARGGVGEGGEAGGGFAAGESDVGIESGKFQVAAARRAFVGVETDKSGEREAHVVGGAGEPAGGVEGAGEGKGVGDECIRGSKTKAEEAAESGGQADGTAGVGAEGERNDAGGDGGGGTTAGAAGGAAGKVRVFAIAVVWVFAGDAVGEFVEVGFAGEDGAGGVEGLDDCGVARRCGTDFGEEGGAGEGGMAGDVEEIFEEIRNAAERGGGIGGGEVTGENGFGWKRREDGALLDGSQARAGAVEEFAGGVGGGALLPVEEGHGSARRVQGIS